MRIAVIGAGGVGGYFGGLLAHAGHDVAFVARGEHLRALRERGLQVQSAHGDFTVANVQASDRPAELGPAELILFAVKTYDCEAALAALRPLVASNTAIVTLQNGVEIPERVAAVFGRGAVLAGAVWLVSSMAAPGVIRQESPFRRIVVGELAGGLSTRAQELAAHLAEAGAEAEASADIWRVLWTKLLFIASFSGISSVTRLPAGPLMAAEETRALLVDAMVEVEAVARARGAALDPEVVPRTLAFAQALPPDSTSSMQRDVAAGRRLEADAINGAVVRAGRSTGVPVPVHTCLWSCLQAIDAVARGATRLPAAAEAPGGAPR
jgi:2-dehydropantoate 2-reductase